MKNIKVKRLNDLVILQRKLNTLYNKNKYYKKLYESCNKINIKEDIEDKYIILTMENGRNIFSEVPKETINYMSLTGHFDKDIFDSKTNSISINDYWSLIETIKYLIDILRFDLINAFIPIEKVGIIE